jgi:peptide chain release factor 3
MSTSPWRNQTARRRTFAIISHPDAGKTTLTEKLLMYGGAIHLAGAVKQRGGARKTASDWMEIERQRGISISTSVLQFEYRGRCVNLLDTPGHNDFSEDTYRTLSAVDAAILLIDAAKGVEAQTERLFHVCRQRGIPIATFVNKMDRFGRDPLELVDEVERLLDLPCSPANWPIGAGPEFAGVFDLAARRALLFTAGKADQPVPMRAVEGMGAELEREVGARIAARLRDDVDLLDQAGHDFDRDRFLAGRLSPVFFGSAMTNFGIEPFLDRIVDLFPPPRTRDALPAPVDPDEPRFSAFVFKVQANMDPRHRDRIAFARVCSGRFVRGMEARHVRTGRPLTLNRSVQFMGQERELVEEAYPGDIVGLWDPGLLRIGDTVCEGEPVEFLGVPRFSPEHFVRVRMNDPSRRKQLKAGLSQLSEEGAVQLYFDRGRMERDPVLGAVGPLQFDVTRHRLQSEYGVAIEYEPMAYRHARWVEGEGLNPDRFERPPRTSCLVDVEGRPLVLFAADWDLRTALQDHPNLNFIAAVQPGRSARAPGAR